MSRPDPSLTRDLVEKAQHGDRLASDVMFERYYDRVLAFARRRIGRRLRREVESRDIVQDSLIVAVRRLPDFEMREPQSLMRWLCQIVENQIRNRAAWQDAARRRRSRESEADGLEAGWASVANRKAHSPATELRVGERNQALEARLAKLESRYRELIHARHFEGLSWEAIAERFARPSADAARMMYHKALVKLGALCRRDEVD